MTLGPAIMQRAGAKVLLRQEISMDDGHTHSVDICVGWMCPDFPELDVHARDTGRHRYSEYCYPPKL